MDKFIDLETLNAVTELRSGDLAAMYGGGFWKDLFYYDVTTEHFLASMLIDAHNNPIRPSEYR
ncbi:MAG: hypothetical protein ABIP51_02880 [Bacteroidia bacterium]